MTTPPPSPDPAVDPEPRGWLLEDGPTQFPTEDDDGPAPGPILVGPWVAGSIALLAVLLLAGALLMP